MTDTAAYCPTHGVCPPCREGWGHWTPIDGECVDCDATGPHYCPTPGATRRATSGGSAVPADPTAEDRFPDDDDDWPPPPPWLSFAIVGLVIVALLAAVMWP